MNAKKILLVGLVLAVSACSTDDEGAAISIRGRLAPSDECTFTPSDEYTTGGVLDLSAAYSAHLDYEMAVHVINNLSDPSERSPSQPTSAKTWVAERIRVRILDNALGLASGDYSGEDWLFGQTVEVGGEAAIGVDIPRWMGLAVQPAVAGLGPTDLREVVVGITLLGHTMDGLDLDSNEMAYKLLVCNGCLAVPACDAPGVIVPTSCGGFGQDSAPVCVQPDAAE